MISLQLVSTLLQSLSPSILAQSLSIHCPSKGLGPWCRGQEQVLLAELRQYSTGYLSLGLKFALLWLSKIWYSDNSNVPRQPLVQLHPAHDQSWTFANDQMHPVCKTSRRPDWMLLSGSPSQWKSMETFKVSAGERVLCLFKICCM